VARKRYKPEAIVAKLPQVDVFGLAGPEHGGRNAPDRGERGDVLSVALVRRQGSSSLCGETARMLYLI